MQQKRWHHQVVMVGIQITPTSLTLAALGLLAGGTSALVRKPVCSSSTTTMAPLTQVTQLAQ